MTTEKLSPLNTQVGGSHYKDMAIQPAEFIYKNNIPFIEGCCIKYLCRWKKKGGIKDLEKVKHFVDLLIRFQELAEEREAEEVVNAEQRRMSQVLGRFRISAVASEENKRLQKSKNDAARARMMGFGQVGEEYADEIEQSFSIKARAAEQAEIDELIRETKASLPPQIIKTPALVGRDVAKLINRIATVARSAFHASGFIATEVHLGKKEMKTIAGHEHLLNLKVIAGKNKHMTIEVR